jgi:hypothetical protein
VNSALLQHCASDDRVDLLKLDDREVIMTMNCLQLRTFTPAPYAWPAAAGATHIHRWRKFKHLTNKPAAPRVVSGEGVRAAGHTA